MTRSASKPSFLKALLLAAAGCVAIMGATPAFAASAATDAFVANVHPNVDFLDQASRMAIETSANGKVRAFARGEATEQTLVGNQLDAWTQTHSAIGAVAAVNAPRNVASSVTESVDGVLTGRSVAIDAPVDALTLPRTAAPGTLLPSGEAEIKRLSSMRGHRFDVFYATTQKVALRQLVTLYTDYMRDGDDLALRVMAQRQLRSVQHRLAELAAM